MCPSVVPAGPINVAHAGPLDRSEAHRLTFHLDLGSAGLATLGRRRLDAADGHWSITAARGARAQQTLRSMLKGANAPTPSRCHVEQVAGEGVEVCRVPSYEAGGGYYGAHVAAAWKDAETTFHITAHGYANQERVLTMMRSLIERR